MLTSQTRTRACVVDGPVTVHGWDLSFGVLLKRVCQITPPSRERSIRTALITPVYVHWIVLLAFTLQVSPPFGAETVIVGEAPAPVTGGETLPALDVKATVRVTLPVTVGEKRTMTSWLAPGPRLKDAPEAML